MGGGGWVGGQGECERRIEVFMKIKKIKIDRAGIRTTTSGLENPAHLSTKVNTIIEITKY